jgi:hypothetical protein
MKRSFDDTPANNESKVSCLNPTRWLSSSDYGRRRGVEEPADMDKVLAQEVHNLSLQERNRVYEEIHGVAEPLQEDPEFVAQRLSEFEWHLSTIRNKPAYDFAMQQSPEYVNDRNFRLRFLRSTEFDAHKAAQKIVNHFEFKMELFGQEKLAQNITLDDLNEKDLIYLRSGAIQILPITDRAGRPILFVQFEKTFMALAVDGDHVVCKCKCNVRKTPTDYLSILTRCHVVYFISTSFEYIGILSPP